MQFFSFGFQNEREHRLVFRAPSKGPEAGPQLPRMMGPIEEIYTNWKERIGAGNNGALNRLFSFMKDVPASASYLPTPEKADVQTIMNLTDHAQWLKAFKENPQLFTDPQIALLPDNATFGPLELLRSMDVRKRRELYVGYVDAIVPESVRNPADPAKRIPGLSNDAPDAATRFDNMQNANSLQMVNAAMSAILGYGDWNKALQNDQKSQDGAMDIARESARSYYQMDSGIAQDMYLSGGLQTDYLRALQYQKVAGNGILSTDPTKIMENVGASRFRGALLTGAVGQKELVTLAESLKEWDFERGQSLARTRGNLDTLMVSNRLQYAKEASTMVDAWRGLGGVEKLVLLGAAAFGLWKSKGFRILTAGAAGMYFVQRLLLKDENPIGTWANGLNYVVNTVRGKALQSGFDKTPGAVASTSNRVETTMNFLDDYNMEFLERQSIGFGILFDMPMTELAKRFSISDGQAPTLDVEDPVLNKRISDALRSRGWSASRYKEFFNDPMNRQQVGEAMSYVFFVNASRRPENKLRVNSIMEVMRKLPPGTSISVLGYFNRDYDFGNQELNESDEFREEMQRAHEEYVRLVGEGRNMALNDTQQLGSFMNKSINFTDSAEKTGASSMARLYEMQGIPLDKYDQYVAKEAEVQAMLGPDNTSARLAVSPFGSDRIGIAQATFALLDTQSMRWNIKEPSFAEKDAVLELTVDEFLNMPTAEIVQKWKEKAFAAREKELAAVAPDLIFKLNGDHVEYGDKTAAFLNAKSSVFEFLSRSANTNVKLFRDWFADAGRKNNDNDPLKRI